MLQVSEWITKGTGLLVVAVSIAAIGGCGGGGGGGAGAVSNPPPPSASPPPPLPPPPPPTGGTQFTKVLVLGGSTAAGFQSSGISAATQRQAYGALLATMAGAPFAIPELAGTGCPAPVTAPLAPANSTAGGCTRAAALPAATTGQLAAVPLTRVGEALVVASGNFAAFDSLFIGSRSQVQVAQQVSPTFLVVHLGDDDVLPAAITGILGPLAGGGDPQLTEQSTFSTQYNQLIGDVASASIAGGVLIGVTNPLLYSPLLQPGAFLHAARDATNRFEGKLVNANCSLVTALGTPNPLSNNLVSLRILADVVAPEINCDPAQLGAGSPYLIDAQEQATLTARVDQFNSVISSIATSRNWIYVDVNALLAPLRAETTSGRTDRLRKCQLLPGATTAAQLQTAVLFSCPVTGATAAPNRFGSLSSFDAIYPSAEFHRLLAVKLATDINAKYATTVSTTLPPP